IDYVHVGANGVEFEFQRYRPHSSLTELLSGYDLIQFVVGTPPWACVASNVSRPKILWTATTTRADRATRIRRAGWPRRIWWLAMTRIVESYEREALQKTDVVIALSEYTRRSIQHSTNGKEVAVIPCAIDTQRFHPGRSDSLQPYMLCVGRLSDPRKNIHMLLRAYAELCL